MWLPSPRVIYCVLVLLVRSHNQGKMTMMMMISRDCFSVVRVVVLTVDEVLQHCLLDDRNGVQAVKPTPVIDKAFLGVQRKV